MTKRRFGLQWRLYVCGIALVLISVVVSLIVTRFVIQPTFDVPARPSTTWIAWHVAQIRHDAARVHDELSDLRQRVGIEVSLFDPHGELLLSSASSPPGPLQPQQVARFYQEPTLFETQHGRVGIFGDDGTLLHYVLISYPQPSPLGLALGQIAIALALLAILVLPLARFIASPVQLLADKTRAFGRGDLSVRTGFPPRSDEIGDLAIAFDEMADRITAQRRSELELLANVSHELRTPLSRIRLALELIRDGDIADADSYMEGIDDELVELEQLLADVLTAARLDLAPGQLSKGLPPLHQAQIAGQSLVDAAASRFRLHHPERILDCQAAEGLPDVCVDPVLMRRVLDNLLDNAAKFSSADSPIILRARASQTCLQLRVSDQGIGIIADDLQRIFEPFYRADRSRARATGGVGLGLTLARRIVNAHRGTLVVASTPGRGSEFTVSLPRPGVESLSDAT